MVGTGGVRRAGQRLQRQGRRLRALSRRGRGVCRRSMPLLRGGSLWWTVRRATARRGKLRRLRPGVWRDRAHEVPACALGVCSVHCEDGWSSCDGDPANGCETPGVCTPEMIAQLDNALVHLDELAARIAVDSSRVYWSESGDPGAGVPGRVGASPRRPSGDPVRLPSRQRGCAHRRRGGGAPRGTRGPRPERRRAGTSQLPEQRQVELDRVEGLGVHPSGLPPRGNHAVGVPVEPQHFQRLRDGVDEPDVRYAFARVDR